jgi:hypothetical protein
MSMPTSSSDPREWLRLDKMDIERHFRPPPPPIPKTVAGLTEDQAATLLFSGFSVPLRRHDLLGYCNGAWIVQHCWGKIFRVSWEELMRLDELDLLVESMIYP